MIYIYKRNKINLILYLSFCFRFGLVYLSLENLEIYSVIKGYKKYYKIY